MAALELLKLQNKRTSRSDEELSVLVGGDVILSIPRMIVFVKDKEVSLTKLEFELLRHLMANKGRYLEHSVLLQKVWGEDYQENGNDILRRTMSRLRGKLSEASPDCEYIKVKREVGYKFYE